MTQEKARQAAEAAARSSYGRLVALLSVRCRDIAAAEDALSEAFAAALRVWPNQGVPEKPEAWLLTAARRVLGHEARAGFVRERSQALIELAFEETAAGVCLDFPDDRLKLLFVCAHPAIDAAVRTPLMLQTVLGLDAGRIADAFLVASSAMGQRLVRAKAKIRDAGLTFQTPDIDQLADRLDDVLQAIYAAYGTGWDAICGAGEMQTGLSAEAIFLGRLLVELLPANPEAKGLLALMLYCEARRGARRSPSGSFVPLSEQHPAHWSRDLIIEAEGLLTVASRHAVFGRFQCEAAIQSVHCQRAATGTTHWAAIVKLYDVLAAKAPSLGCLIARAAALSEAGDPRAALQQLDALPYERIANYQPYWATRAHVLQALGQVSTADAAAHRAMELTQDPALADYLAAKYRRLAEL